MREKDYTMNLLVLLKKVFHVWGQAFVTLCILRMAVFVYKKIGFTLKSEPKY